MPVWPVLAAVPAGLAAGWLLAPLSRPYTGEPTTRVRVLTAVTAAAVCGALAWRFGATAPLVAYLYLGVVGTLLTFIDFAVQRLPDPYTLSGYVIGPVLLAAVAPFTPDGWPRLLHGLVGLAALWLVYGVQHFFLPDAIGRGDVKLAGVLGLFLGWLGADAWLWGLIAGFFYGGLVSVALLLLGHRRKHIAFGPYMLAGALTAILATVPPT